MKTLMKNTTMIVALLTMTSLSARADEAKNETPKAALEKMAKAMAKGDAESFVSCFDATQEEAKVLKAMGEFVNQKLSGIKPFSRLAAGQGDQ